MLDLKDVVFEEGRYWILKVKGGFEVYETSITCSVRRAFVGFEGDEGLKRAKAIIADRVEKA